MQRALRVNPFRLRRSALLVVAATALAVGGSAFLVPTHAGDDDAPDPFLWLEDVTGERSLEWVEVQNTASQAELTAYPEFSEIEADTRAVLDARDRIIFGTRRGKWVYDFWRGAKNPRGSYRRATYDSYVAGKPHWEPLLDIDALAEKEGRNWIWKGMSLLRPDYERGLVRLSIGGSDAVVVREFDVATRSFVEDGFQLPEAKCSVEWIDADTVYVDTDFGPGSLTESGYPRIVKRWSRGTPLSEAHAVFEGRQGSVSVGASRSHYGDRTLDWLSHSTSYYTAERYLVEGDELVRLHQIPPTARVHTVFDGRVFVELKDDWEVAGTTHAQGTVLTIGVDDLRAGKTAFDVFFTPTASISLQDVDRTKSYLFVQVMEDVRDRLYRYQRADDGSWARDEMPFDGHGTIRTSSMDADHDSFLLRHSSFLEPTTLYHVEASTLERTVVQQEPQRFDPSPYASTQHFATSEDGTRVPYFLVARKDLVNDGGNRTLLYAYGGFRIAQRPFYLGTAGRNWLARGGVFVVANIRGGDEYGPRWHAAALRENRHKAFEDLEAVAEDLITRKITDSNHLGIRGGSNGGLLVAAAFTRRPDLYGAVVCQVPLLDMRRYNKLLAGASWMAEYGDPDVPDDWAFIRTYSPYHVVTADAEYPRVLFMTSTRDDRVHPAHARKMVARMQAQGHPVLYYENTEGGHAGAANSAQRAHATALITTYLLHELGDADPARGPPTKKESE